MVKDLTAESSAEYVGLTKQARQPLGLYQVISMMESLVAGPELADSLAPNFLPFPPKIEGSFQSQHLSLEAYLPQSIAKHFQFLEPSL